jgi:hypothetical protein
VLLTLAAAVWAVSHLLYFFGEILICCLSNRWTLPTSARSSQKLALGKGEFGDPREELH